jgi:di/tricarboxylate transporter
MSWETLQIIVVLALVAIVFFGFVRETLAPEVVALSAVSVLLLLGILKIQDVLAVFSNSAPITVACLFVLSAALERTGVIDAFGRQVSRVPWGSPWLALFAVMVLAMLLSAFVNNTPVVVIMTPVLIALARTMQVASSRFLMPLSYASILGGTCTLIGTSTNIIADGVARAHGLQGFGMFEFTPPGLIHAAVGLVYIMVVGRWLIPDRRPSSRPATDRDRRLFLIEVLVPQDSPVVGRTPSEAGLTAARGFDVIDVIRDDSSLGADQTDTTLAAGDRLVIRTHIADVLGLRASPKVSFETEGSPALRTIRRRDTALMEGIVGPDSAWVGQHVADLKPRRLYGVYILGIHRQNARLSGNFDEVRLAFGDTLLLEGPPEGLKRLFDHRMLINLTEPSEQAFRRGKAPIAVAALLTLMVLATVEMLPIAAAALIAATAVVAAGCLDAQEAYEAIHWRILMLIFSMLALGTAMETTGAAMLIVHQVAAVAVGLGPVGVLSLVYLMTSLLTEMMSNNATAILMMPIAIGVAGELGVDPRPFAVAVIFAASASFATPIGYQTNTFVYGAGSYRFTDFLKVGGPLNILLWINASIVIPLFFPLD